MDKIMDIDKHTQLNLLRKEVEELGNKVKAWKVKAGH